MRNATVISVHAALIKALGGPLVVSRIAHVDRTTPGKWPSRGIPARYWPALAEAAAAAGVDITLADIEAAAPRYRTEGMARRRPKAQVAA